MFKIICIGLLAGIINGMFSTGAGLLLVPIFVFLFEIDERKSRGTSMFCILPMVITTSMLYHRQDDVDYIIAILVAIGGIIGGIIGATLLKKLKVKNLKILFIIFLAYMAFRFIFS